MASADLHIIYGDRASQIQGDPHAVKEHLDAAAHTLPDDVKYRVSHKWEQIGGQTCVWVDTHYFNGKHTTIAVPVMHVVNV